MPQSIKALLAIGVAISTYWPEALLLMGVFSILILMSTESN